jgi:predicted nucleic acid-binding protein
MASKAVFADTSFFFALVAKRDPAHQAAVAAYTKLICVRGRVYVIDETLTLTEASEAVAMEDIAPERFVAAKTYFRKHADHGYSFTDCTSFVLIRELAADSGSVIGHLLDRFSPKARTNGSRISQGFDKQCERR